MGQDRGAQRGPNGYVAAAGLGSLLAARRRSREERDLWAQAESGRAGSLPPGGVARLDGPPDVSRHEADQDDDAGQTSDPDKTVAGHPS